MTEAKTISLAHITHRNRDVVRDGQRIGEDWP